MKSYFFTFGQSHIHKIGEYVLNKDVVVLIRADSMDSAVNKMFTYFKDKWAFVYEAPPDMSFYPRGIFDLDKYEFITSTNKEEGNKNDKETRY